MQVADALKNIKAKHASYQEGVCDATDFIEYLKIHSVMSENIYRCMKAMSDSGALQKLFPVQMEPATLGDAYDDKIEVLNTRLDLIVRGLNSGKIDPEKANQMLKEIQTEKASAWEDLNYLEKTYHYATDNPLVSFFSNRYSEAKQLVEAGLEFGAKQVDKSTSIVTNAAEAVTGTVGSLKYIVPIALIGGGILLYKLVTSDTGKALATRRLV